MSKMHKRKSMKLKKERTFNHVKGNKFKFLYAKRQRPTLERCVVNSEECVRIPLSRGRWTIVSAASLYKLEDYNWYFNGGYAVRRDRDGNTVFMHRVLTGAKPGAETDHINGDRLDNRDCNLRTATRSQNSINRPIQANNKSGVVGVSRHNGTGKWTVRIHIEKKAKYLGIFSSLEDATSVRLLAEEKYYGNFKPRVLLRIASNK
jgi:HNH endonuclease